MSEETIRVLHQGDPNDTRFQFEVIKQLAESVRGMGENQTKILERLARIEEQRVHESVAKLHARIDVLEKDKDLRDGANGFRDAIMKWWPAIALLLLVAWTAGRALGFFHLPEPPTQPAIIRPEMPGGRKQ